MTRDEAIQAIREDSRALISPAFAEEIAGAFGEVLGWPGRRTADFDRATYYADTAELPSVSMDHVAGELAARLVPGYVYPGSPYQGAGSSADHRTKHAADALAAHFAGGGSAVSPPVALDWQSSTEHRGLQGVAFPECITRGEQGALL